PQHVAPLGGHLLIAVVGKDRLRMHHKVPMVRVFIRTHCHSRSSLISQSPISHKCLKRFCTAFVHASFTCPYQTFEVLAIGYMTRARSSFACNPNYFVRQHTVMNSKRC